MTSIQKEKETFEIKSAQSSMNFKMKEDEIDTLLIALEGIFVIYILINLDIE